MVKEYNQTINKEADHHRPKQKKEFRSQNPSSSTLKPNSGRGKKRKEKKREKRPMASKRVGPANQGPAFAGRGPKSGRRQTPCQVAITTEPDLSRNKPREGIAFTGSTPLELDAHQSTFELEPGEPNLT